MPLAYGKGAPWGLVMHDMLGWESGDHVPAEYGPLCPAGGELVVFATEPCVAKAHGPSFQYLRGGRLICTFSFEGPDHRAGEEPDLLHPALTSANLIGPRADWPGTTTRSGSWRRSPDSSPCPNSRCRDRAYGTVSVMRCRAAGLRRENLPHRSRVPSSPAGRIPPSVAA